MYSFPQYQLSIFTKSPVLGKAKTRMQPQLSKEFSLELHTRLVDYVLLEWSRSKVCPLKINLAGDQNYFSSVLPQWQKLSLSFQEGEDLGERMYAAAITGLKEFKGVILVGTDCPFINTNYLMKACHALNAHDVVIGPAADGGYVLLGLKKCYKELFMGIQWGGNTVFSDTIDRINENNLRYIVLPELDDIDHPKDLPKLKHMSPFRNVLLSIGI